MWQTSARHGHWRTFENIGDQESRALVFIEEIAERFATEKGRQPNIADGLFDCVRKLTTPGPIWISEGQIPYV